MVKLAVFDCDGTLVDGQAAVCEAMESAFAFAGHASPPRALVRRIVGLSLPRAVRQLAPELADADQRAVVEAYKEAFRNARYSGALEEPLFDGIVPLIDRLASAGWSLGVATGKSDRGLNACLAAHGLLGRFVTLQTADRHPSKPHPAMLEAALFEAGVAPAEAVMIGDTTFDIDMARMARVRAIGVDWGYHTPEELHEAGAEVVVSSAAELGDYLA
jgi:phosphoglycolate phosphatase